MRERGRRVRCEGLRNDGTRCSKWSVWRPEVLKKHALENHPQAGKLCWQHLVGPEAWKGTQRRGGHRRLVRFHEKHRAGLAALEREAEERERKRRLAIARFRPPDPPEEVFVVSSRDSVPEDEIDRSEALDRAERERAGAREGAALRRWQNRQYAARA
jgi:hypothetical protein